MSSSSARGLGRMALALWLATIPVRAAAAVPGTPTLSSPLDGSNVASTMIPFRWNPISDATDYCLQVATDPCFANVVFGDWVGNFLGVGNSGLGETYANTQSEASRAVPQDVDVPQFERVVHVPEFDMEAAEGETFASLDAERTIADGDYTQSVISPSGEHVLFTKPGFSTLYVGAVKDGSVRILTRGRGVGYEPVWREDSAAVGIRMRTQGTNEARRRFVDLDGVEVQSAQESRKLRVVVDSDEIYVLEDSNRYLISRGSDRFRDPQLSPDRRFVVFHGMSTGVYVYRMEDQKLIYFGRGHQPSFSGNGHYLVFHRSVDDGHKILASDLYIADLTSPTPRISPLTQTKARMERSPSLDATGDLVAFSANGKIFVAKVVAYP